MSDALSSSRHATWLSGFDTSAFLAFQRSAESIVRHNSCGAAKVVRYFITLALYLYFSVVSPFLIT